MNNIKSRVEKIWEAVFTRLIVTAIIAAVLSLVAYIKRITLLQYVSTFLIWLDSQHTYTKTGWAWLYLFATLFFVPILISIFIWFCRREPRKYRGKQTVVPILAEWVLAHEGELHNEMVVRFREVDIDCGLKRRSTRKYLKQVIANHPSLTIVRITSRTAVIKGT